MVTVPLMCQKAATNIYTLIRNLHGMDRTGSCMVSPFPSQPLLPPDIQVKAEKNWNIKILIGTTDINRDYRSTLQVFYNVIYRTNCRLQISRNVNLTSL